MCQVVDNNSNQPQRIFRPKLQPTDITIVLGRKSACISLGRASGIAFLGAVMKPFGFTLTGQRKRCSNQLALVCRWLTPSRPQRKTLPPIDFVGFIQDLCHQSQSAN
ncbi:Uncharacterised protein [Leminorella grimontii]|nr:hypothetical protein GLGR_2235 [Leminorella grimontii ATCC 33999 = DSM 5078]VFS60918.1 Uncharacterised protein [Leminorella grimontii]